MRYPLVVTFRHETWSEAILGAVHREAARLDAFADRILRCHVVIDVPHRHHHKGRRAGIAITLIGRGFRLAVHRGSGRGAGWSDLYDHIREGFVAVRNALRDRLERPRRIRHRERRFGLPVPVPVEIPMRCDARPFAPRR
jgi:hypothetical protein